MQIRKIIDSQGKKCWLADGLKLSKELPRVNYILAGYDRLLSERNELEVLCKQQALLIEQLSQK